PLTFNGFVKAGTLIYDDLFTIYPFENRLFTLRMTGQEIKDYLEASYDGWINTVNGKSEDEHLLKITAAPDPRTGQDRWSFVGRAYNLDSAAGLHYTVDVTKPAGKRVQIASTADGKDFCLDREYVLAMNSYRASGGGGLLKAAGIDSEKMAARLVARYPEIRDLLHGYLGEFGSIDPAVIGDPEVVGSWRFIPESLAEPLMRQDMDLLF
ncbi:MAG: 5'-nucleotidase C-terminal domain-containing protein, partial [Candidatus Cryptobacteroides sp.]